MNEFCSETLVWVGSASTAAQNRRIPPGDGGQTQEAVASQLDLSERTIRSWLSKGLLQPPSSKRALEVRPEEVRDASAAEASPIGEANGSSAIKVRTEWTAFELLAVGISRKNVPRMLLTLTTLAKLGNLRLHKWFTRVMHLPVVPPQIKGWRDAYAFFPILARDIDAPALVHLSRLMHGIARPSSPPGVRTLRRPCC